MTEPYVPIMENKFDISIDLSGDVVTLKGLDQTEVMRFMTLMPKIYVKRYSKDVDIPRWVMRMHEENKDGNNE